MLVLACLLLCSLSVAGPVAAGSATGPAAEPRGGSRHAAESPVPLLAYYYQWFDPGSWQRAKTDLPHLGPYSSDDTTVMRQQIVWAKSAGIDGFIVSWKDSPVNDRRLEKLIKVAEAENFRLAMIYQGLDFSRRPLPTDRVAEDFRTFRDRFAQSPAFLRLGGKPLTVWSGTWKFSEADVARVTSAVRDDLLVLSTEKSVSGYRRIADVTDGLAYYWSSVNPGTNRGYEDKLGDLSRAVHGDGKYWVAPFAPGFDARPVGGTSTVPREDGRTLRAEYSAAVRSSPDVLGLISWNEFSENTHVEPSRNYGFRYLDELRDLRTTPAPDAPADSGDEEAAGSGDVPAWQWQVPAAAVSAAVVVGAVVRRRHSVRRGSER